MTPVDGTDPEEFLMALVAAADGPPPSWILGPAADAWSWRDPDASLAELVHDDALGAAGRRFAGDRQRSVAYAMDGIDVELVVREGPAGVTVDVVIVSSGPGPAAGLDVMGLGAAGLGGPGLGAVRLEAVARTAAGEVRSQVEVPEDGIGSFVVPAGSRMSLTIGVGERRWVTPWLTV